MKPPTNTTEREKGGGKVKRKKREHTCLVSPHPVNPCSGGRRKRKGGKKKIEGEKPDHASALFSLPARPQEEKKKGERKGKGGGHSAPLYSRIPVCFHRGKEKGGGGL